MSNLVHFGSPQGTTYEEPFDVERKPFFIYIKEG
jgi:hypothetical protein